MYSLLIRRGYNFMDETISSEYKTQPIIRFESGGLKEFLL
jgi:hypothetical protein